MTKELTVEKQADGTYRRSDGVELQPAERYPYYVMATVHGEYRHRYEVELAAKNRRIWNGWACDGMSDKQRAAAAETTGLSIEELAPLTAAELDLVKEALVSRLNRDAVILRSDLTKFEALYFLKPLFFERFVFNRAAVFSAAYFANYVSFGAAHFATKADFDAVHFVEYANFEAAHFGRSANFNTAHFAGDAEFYAARFVGHANFDAAHFDQYASFDAAQFDGVADFDSAQFDEAASFDDGAFAKRTDFGGAKFAKHAPSFFQREMHDNTTFSDRKALWPKVDPETARANKNAYRRLRQISAAQQNKDNEQFFLRQEMACDAVLKDDALSRFLVRGYGWISDYGLSVGRPGGALLAFWLVPVYWFVELFKSDFWETLPAWGPDHWDALGRAAGFSFSNLFTFFGLGRRHFGDVWLSADSWVHFIGGAQTVLGFVFLFFLGLGLRNRFRLK